MKSQTLFALAIVTLWARAAQASVQISTSATQNMNCTGGICTPTAANAVLNTTDLTNMLSTSDATVATGSGALAIAVMSPFSWASTHRLTLDASGNVSFRAAVQVSGQGAVTVVTNDGGGTAGDLVFFPGGKLDFSDTGSSLIVNGNAYTLVNDVATLAADITGNSSGFYALAQDYDATPDGQYDGAPIGTTFFGGFDGLGHAISNLSMRSDDALGLSLGLFAQSSGTIRNINLVNATVSATSGVSGGLTIGSLAGDNVGIIKYSSATNGTVAETNSTDGLFGGLVGTNGGQIISSSAAMSVTGVYAGGLAGDNRSVITGSSAAGTVNGQAAAGGIAAVNYDVIALSHTSGDVSAKRPGSAGRSYIGGLVGWNQGGLISKSYSSGHTSGSSHAVLGGLVGWNMQGTVTQGYALGITQSSKGGNIGGIVGTGNISSKVTQVYAAGPTRGSSSAILGGVVGSDKSKAANVGTAYWDLDTTGITDPQKGAGNPLNAPGITGLSDAQLKSGLPAGLDPAIWAIKKKINNGYPYLIANHPPQ